MNGSTRVERVSSAGTTKKLSTKDRRSPTAIELHEYQFESEGEAIDLVEISDKVVPTAAFSESHDEHDPTQLQRQA